MGCSHRSQATEAEMPVMVFGIADVMGGQGGMRGQGGMGGNVSQRDKKPTDKYLWAFRRELLSEMSEKAVSHPRVHLAPSRHSVNRIHLDCFLLREVKELQPLLPGQRGPGSLQMDMPSPLLCGCPGVGGGVPFQLNQWENTDPIPWSPL